jgi:hypothetical protein
MKNEGDDHTQENDFDTSKPKGFSGKSKIMDSAPAATKPPFRHPTETREHKGK